MIDSAGERLSLKGGDVGYNGLAKLLKNWSIHAGVIPRITLLLGPCTGPMAQVPVLSDFVIANEETGFLWLGGEVETDDAGSAEFHMAESVQRRRTCSHAATPTTSATPATA